MKSKKCEICKRKTSKLAVHGEWAVCHSCYRKLSPGARRFVKTAEENLDAEIEVIKAALHCVA